VLRGVQFILQSQEGVNWIVFASEPISFVFDSRVRTNVVSSKVFNGIIRLAVIPPSSKLKDTNDGMVHISSSTGLRRLVYHAGVYPVGAKVDYDFGDPTADTTTTITAKKVLSGITGAGLTAQRKKISDTRVSNVHFHFTTKSINSNTNSPSSASKTTGLLMLSLPHHAVALTQSHVLDSTHFDLVFQCIKGAMTPVVGSSWTYEEKLLPLGFESNTPSSLSSSTNVFADKTISKILLDQIEEDLDIALPARNENIYGFGKQVARLAQLAHIADVLVQADGGGPPTQVSESNSTVRSSSNSNGLTGSGDDRTDRIRERAANKLSSYLEMLLNNQLSDSLLFDASLGGLVSVDGLSDWNSDFGNGRYNGKS
jgi:endoglucanase Acf2